MKTLEEAFLMGYKTRAKLSGLTYDEASRDYAKILFNQLQQRESVPAETLVIASEQRSDLANSVVADKKEILEEAISIMRKHCLKNDINQIAYPWITIHLMDGSANIHYDIDENDDSDGTETINLDATIKKLLE